jgi:hypothetical protein
MKPTIVDVLPRSYQYNTFKGGGVPLKMYFKKNILGCILPFLLVSFQFSRMKITIAAT